MRLQSEYSFFKFRRRGCERGLAGAFPVPCRPCHAGYRFSRAWQLGLLFYAPRHDFPRLVRVSRRAFNYAAKDSGNFGRNSNGKVRFSFFRPKYSGSPLASSGGGPLISVGIFRPKFAVSFLTSQFFAQIREFGKGITSGKSNSYWLAWFNRKISFHFLISVCCNWQVAKTKKYGFTIVTPLHV